ncbi:MAG: hypothetical protein WAM60_03410 [Candidatus Promineifilaceae bacterium]
MNESEKSDHAFIIRIWKENRELKDAPPTWRGVIEHVPSGKRRYLKDLAHIIIFILPFFEEMGVKIDAFGRQEGRFQRVKQWLQRPSSDPELSDETGDL